VPSTASSTSSPSALHLMHIGPIRKASKQFPAHKLGSACTIWGVVRLPWGANPQGTLARATTSLGLRSSAVWRTTLDLPARRSMLLQSCTGEDPCDILSRAGWHVGPQGGRRFGYW
jgi:hypothetical protein